MLDDPNLRQRLARVYAECGNSYTETGRHLGLDKYMIRRLLLQRFGPIGKTRARLEVALLAYESKVADTKHIRNINQTRQTVVPELAEEVLRYVLQAVEAQRGGGRRP